MKKGKDYRISQKVDNLKGLFKKLIVILIVVVIGHRIYHEIELPPLAYLKTK